MHHDMSNRVALVTGASRGLGAAIALRLGSCGAKVAVNYFGSREKAERVVKQIRDAGGAAEAFGGDVRDEAQVRQMVKDVRSKLGPIDILVINATGPQPMLSIEELTWQSCLDQLEFFVKSPVLFMGELVGEMKKRRHGRVIHVGSEVFPRGTPAFSNYVAAKGAQTGLMRSWAIELAPFGITVNLVAPGWIPTERHVDDSQESKDAYAATVPMRKMGLPEDVAEAVAYLASNGAGFVTGQQIAVNGGNSLG